MIFKLNYEEIRSHRSWEVAHHKQSKSEKHCMTTWYNIGEGQSNQNLLINSANILLNEAVCSFPLHICAWISLWQRSFLVPVPSNINGCSFLLFSEYWTYYHYRMSHWQALMSNVSLLDSALRWMFELMYFALKTPAWYTNSQHPHVTHPDWFFICRYCSICACS